MCETASAQAKLDAVMKAARVILEKRTFVEIARAIFDLCREQTGATSGYVALLSAAGQENEVLFLESGGLPCSVDPQQPMPIRGLRARAYELGKALYHNDFFHSRYMPLLPPGHVRLSNVLFAPLRLEGRVVGLIGLANKPGEFNDADAEIAGLFGELAAIALANSRYLDLLSEKNRSLEQALAEVRTLRELLPMCTHCGKVRDHAGLWTRLEACISEHTDTRLSHGLCPECVRELHPELADEICD